LPEISSPILAKINPPGIDTMRFGESLGKAVFFPRHGHEMDMVGHKAICPDFDAGFLDMLAEHVEIKSPVALSEKNRLISSAPLDDMMRDSRNHDARTTGHGRKPSPEISAFRS